MTIIVVQVGQCGNQLGFDFFNEISGQIQNVTSENSHRGKNGHGALTSAAANVVGNVAYRQELGDRFFKYSENEKTHIPRAILVDTEPKVIKQIQYSSQQTGKWKYAPQNAFFKKKGAGNNWAYGYYGHGSPSKEDILNLIQKEVEQCEYLGGFLVIMSCAGGTGSGLGTFLSEALRENYPQTPLINQVVWPFSNGEVTVQNYNTLLTLGHLQDVSDSICLLENDQLHRCCSQSLAMKDVDLKNLNVIGARQMASLYLSSYQEKREANFADILCKLGSHPSFKLVRLLSVPQETDRSAPFSSYSWPSLIKSLHRSLAQQTAKEHNIHLANLLVLRGSESKNVDVSLLKSLRYASWMPEEHRLNTLYHPLPLFRLNRSSTLATNSQSFLPQLDGVVDKAWTMYHSRAYLHHYAKHGLEDQSFISCFEKVENIVAKYTNVSN